MNIRTVRRALKDAGYERVRVANSHHVLYRNPLTGHIVTIGPDFFKGHRRGGRWLRAFRRKRAK